MLHPELTQIDYSVPAVVGDTAITEEGMALVIDGELPDGNGITVKPSTGASGERFYGISMFERRPPSIMPDVFEFTLPNTLVHDDVVAELPFTPDPSGTKNVLIYQNDELLYWRDSGVTPFGIWIDGRAVKLSTGTNNKHLAFDDTDGFYVSGITVGATIRIQYSYTPSQAQKAALVGTNINLTPLSAGAEVTCIRKGTIFTTNYDADSSYEVNSYSERITYSIGRQLAIGSSGRFKVAETGNLSADIATVIHVPSADNPFLGVELL